MRLKSKVLILGLIIVIGGFTVLQINKGIQKEQALEKQEKAKVERSKIDKNDYNTYQDYLNTFIDRNVSEIEAELTKELWKQDGNKFTSVHGDTITIKSDKYNTIVNVNLKANTLTKVYIKD